MLGDNSGNIWLNINNTNPDYYNSFKRGDLIQIIGKISYFNEKVKIFPESLIKLKNPNNESLNLLEMIKKVKIEGKLIALEKIEASLNSIFAIDYEKYKQSIDQAKDNLLKIKDLIPKYSGYFDEVIQMISHEIKDYEDLAGFKKKCNSISLIIRTSIIMIKSF